MTTGDPLGDTARAAAGAARAFAAFNEAVAGAGGPARVTGFPVLVQPEGAEARVFTESFTIGRRGDLALDDEYASPFHARCFPDGGEWMIEDLGSTNGTWTVPGMSRVRAPRRLAKGDVVMIGHTRITVVPA